MNSKVVNTNGGDVVITSLLLCGTTLVLVVSLFGTASADCPTKASPLTTSALELVADCGPVPWDGWLLSREVYAQLQANLAKERVRATEAESDLVVAWSAVAGALAVGGLGLVLGLR